MYVDGDGLKILDQYSGRPHIMGDKFPDRSLIVRQGTLIRPAKIALMEIAHEHFQILLHFTHPRKCYFGFRQDGGERKIPLHYKIGEFADLSGVSAKTLRFYDEIGLLRPASDWVAVLIDCSIVQIDQQQSLNWIDAALDELGESEHPIPVVVKRRPSVLIASIRSRIQTYAEIERCEQELLRELPAQSVGDLRGVLWHHCADSDYLEGEAFVALKERVAARSIYDLKQLPSAILACAYSGMDDHSAEQAYDAIRKWMRIRGYRLAGPKRELYVDEVLEIQFPLKSA